MGKGIRDRIKGLRRVKASELLPHPQNWRIHPETQRAALQGVLEEIGWADALLARKLPDGRLQLVDGHLRKDLAADDKVPVLVVDLDDAEAQKVLVSLDPLASLANANRDELDALLQEVRTQDPNLRAMLDDLRARGGLAESIGTGPLPESANGREIDESIADSVKIQTCPKCGHKFPI